MKSSSYIKIFTLVLISVISGCNNQQKGMSQSNPQYFATPEEAIKKAQADLIVILKSNPGVAPGVDEKTLASAQPALSLKHHEMDFDKILTVDSTEKFDRIIKSEKSTVYPLVANGKVVTIIELFKSEKGWSITGIGSKSTADDLNTIRSIAGADSEISIYEVPNLQVRVYSVRKNGRELLYTNFNGFSLKEGVNSWQLLPVLKAAAAEFNKNYGESIKNQKLVK